LDSLYKPVRNLDTTNLRLDTATFRIVMGNLKKDFPVSGSGFKILSTDNTNAIMNAYDRLNDIYGATLAENLILKQDINLLHVDSIEAAWEIKTFKGDFRQMQDTNYMLRNTLSKLEAANYNKLFKDKMKIQFDDSLFQNNLKQIQNYVKDIISILGVTFPFFQYRYYLF
jgi:hypothetical protein